MKCNKCKYWRKNDRNIEGDSFTWLGICKLKTLEIKLGGEIYTGKFGKSILMFEN